jgi:hypothetical protein
LKFELEKPAEQYIGAQTVNELLVYQKAEFIEQVAEDHSKARQP